MDKSLFSTNDKRMDNSDVHLYENKETSLMSNENIPCENSKQCNTALSYQQPDLHLKADNSDKTVYTSSENDDKGPQSLLPIGIINGDNSSMITTVPDGSLIMCKLCKMKFNGPTPYQHHVKGKTHQKQLRKEKLLQSFSQAQGLTASENKSLHSTPAILNCMPTSDTSLLEHNLHLKPRNTEETVCASSEKKHIDQSTHSVSSVDIPNVENSYSFASGLDTSTLNFCKLCKMNFNGPTPYEHHIKGKTHQKQLQKEKLIQRLSQVQGSLPPGNETIQSCSAVQGYIPVSPDGCLTAPNSQLLKDEKEMLSSNGVIFHSEYKCLYCTICKKSFSGIENAHEHLASKKHLKAVMQNETLKSIKNQSALNNFEEGEKHSLQTSTQYAVDEKLHYRLKALEISPKNDQMNMSVSASETDIKAENLKSEEKYDQAVQHSSNSTMSHTESDELSCKICGMQFNTIIEVAVHFESIEHQRNEQLNAKA